MNASTFRASLRGEPGETREYGWNAERMSSVRYGPYGEEIVLHHPEDLGRRS